MKMCDVFDLPVSPKGIRTKVNPPARLMDAVAHAVNCHDDLLAALLAANEALFDAAEARGFDPPLSSSLEIMIADALVLAMGADALRGHVERQRARAAGET